MDLIVGFTIGVVMFTLAYRMAGGRWPWQR